MKYTKHILIVLAIFFSFSTLAQDIHFSQFYASPLTLNPALTGVFDASYRFAGIYRNQWRSISDGPYSTYALSYDMKLFEHKMTKNIFGGGVSAMQDKSGDGKLTNLTFMVSGSYHITLDKKAKHLIGVGVQLGYVQKTVKLSNLNFPSQHNGTEFDPSLSNAENIGDESMAYFDIQTGLTWFYQISEKVGMYNGGSFFHLTRPSESFLNDGSNKLPMRYAIHGGFRIKTGKQIYFTPNYVVMKQDKAREINLGTGFEYHFTQQEIIAGIGCWYRFNDAPVALASLEYKAVRLGISYDINTSNLKPASDNRGAFEVSIIVLGKIKEPDTGPLLKPCPRL